MKVLLGGTFDPVHFGHLQMATEVSEYLGQIPVSLLPCYQPVHKQSSKATADDRVQMLRLALEGSRNLDLDLHEVTRGSPSYTINTLRDIREKEPGRPILLVMGSDSFLSIGSWRDAQDFHKYCNILVMQRPESVLDDSQQETHLASIGYALAKDAGQLQSAASGLLHFFSSSLLDISSSKVRDRVRKKYTIRYLVPSAVSDYICDNKLYLIE